MLNYSREIKERDIEYLEKETLLDILEELRKINEGYCTVQVQDTFHGIDIYGLFTMTEEELKNYIASGGVWNYQTPSYWTDLIQCEMGKMEYAKDMLQQMQG